MPATLTDGADYPVGGECKICHGRIGLGYLMQWEWQCAPMAVTASETS